MKFDLEKLNQLTHNTLPGHLGIRVVAVSEGELHAEMDIAQHHLAPNSYLHAGSVVTLADTACGFGCIANLPQGAQNFTTVELKSNHLGTAREGTIAVAAKMLHGGRTTQVWDATVTDKANGKTIALFRCTQMILYPKG